MGLYKDHAGPGEWFRILSGAHKGEWHLAGWMLSALMLTDGYLGFAICPRCHVMVITEEDLRRNAYGDQQRAHESWHARTDYPLPVEAGSAQD